MFENMKDKKNNVHYSRYIASFKEAGGSVRSLLFKDWLRHLELDDVDVDSIWNLAINGKMELTDDASEFIREHKSKYAPVKFDPDRRL